MKKTICRIISGLLVAVIALAAMAVPAMAADDFVDVPSNAWYFDTVEFAVYCPKRDQTVNPSGNNYAVFKRVLGNRK